MKEAIRDEIRRLSREVDDAIEESTPYLGSGHVYDRHPIVHNAWKLTAVCFSITIVALVLAPEA